MSVVAALIEQNSQYPYKFNDVVLGQYDTQHPWYPGCVISTRESSDNNKSIQIRWMDPDNQWSKDDKISWLKISSVLPFTVDNLKSCNNEFEPREDEIEYHQKCTNEAKQIWMIRNKEAAINNDNKRKDSQIINQHNSYDSTASSEPETNNSDAYTPTSLEYKEVK